MLALPLLFPLVLAVAISLAGHAQAHELEYRVERRSALSVELFSGGDAFDFESYEIYRVGEEKPFQVGQTDALGRLVFLPDRAGEWRIAVFSEDGHGVDFSLSTDAEGSAERAAPSLLERYPRIVVGGSIIFGVFGLVSLAARGRRAN